MNNQQPQSLFSNSCNQTQNQGLFQQQLQSFNVNFGIGQQGTGNILPSPIIPHCNTNLFGNQINNAYRQQSNQILKKYVQLGIILQQYPMHQQTTQLTNINFKDDEKIKPKEEAAKQITYKYDLNEKLSFEVRSLYKMGKLLSSRTYMERNQSYLPGIVSLKTQDQTAAQNKESQRVGVDLICLIDISGSMIGVKIEMVKASLIVLLQFLGDNDRLQLITFDNEAHRLTPLKTVTEQNKSYSLIVISLLYFTSIIYSIKANGGNRISEATKMAFYQLKSREYENNVTSIFLLSDGVDFTYPEVQEQIKTVNEVFTLHTFGFGQDHDAKMMTQICNLKSGSFYFVQDVTLLDEFFADALGGLISVVGEQLEITLQSQAPSPYQDIQISKTYGNMWQKKGNQYYITQPQLASGTRKDYVFELALPKFEGKIEDNQRNVKVIEAVLKVKDPVNGVIITKQTSLTLTFFNQDEQINQNESDIDVYAQYYRVKGTEIIDDARKACEQNKNEDAQKLIDGMLILTFNNLYLFQYSNYQFIQQIFKFIIQIQKNQNVASQCTGIIQDLQQAKQASARNTYNLFGQKQMCQMVSNNYQQGGVNSMFSSAGMQLQQVQPSAFSNVQQQQMMFQVQSSKSSNKQH